MTLLLALLALVLSMVTAVGVEEIMPIEIAVRREFPRSEWRVARCIVWYESTDNPRAVGTADEVGLMQIHPVHFWRFERERLTEVDYNVAAGAVIWREAGSWQPWPATRRLCDD